MAHYKKYTHTHTHFLFYRKSDLSYLRYSHAVIPSCDVVGFGGLGFTQQPRQCVQSRVTSSVCAIPCYAALSFTHSRDPKTGALRILTTLPPLLGIPDTNKRYYCTPSVQKKVTCISLLSIKSFRRKVCSEKYTQFFL